MELKEQVKYARRKLFLRQAQLSKETGISASLLLDGKALKR